jgi:TorA maturation chaperone TorD
MRHLHPWAEKFFRQVQQTKAANFYRAVGLLGERFMQLENEYLNIQDH